MASYEILFPVREDGTYSVREMEYCQEHATCVHEPRPTGRWLRADGTWGDGWGDGPAEFATQSEAEDALHVVRASGWTAPEYVPLESHRSPTGEIEFFPAHAEDLWSTWRDAVAGAVRDARAIIWHARLSDCGADEPSEAVAFVRAHGITCGCGGRPAHLQGDAVPCIYDPLRVRDGDEPYFERMLAWLRERRAASGAGAAP